MDPVRNLLLLLMLMPLSATAEIYRWVDAQGQVHFGARPAPGAEQLKVRPQVIERDEATRERERRAERFFEARRQEQEVAAQQAGETRARQVQECGRLRNELATLAQGGRYFRTDANGDRVYYSEEEVNAARRQLADRIDHYCS